MKRGKVLAFVFVNPFHLDVEERFGRHFYPGALRNQRGETALVRKFHVAPLLLELWIASFISLSRCRMAKDLRFARSIRVFSASLFQSFQILAHSFAYSFAFADVDLEPRKEYGCSRNGCAKLIVVQLSKGILTTSW